MSQPSELYHIAEVLCQQAPSSNRHLEIMPATLSGLERGPACHSEHSEGLAGRTERSFAALRMTGRDFVILSAAKDLWWTSGGSPGALYYRITIYQTV